MLFRRIVFTALLVGICSSLVLTLFQQFFVSPIIFAAEVYEHAAPLDLHSGESAWAPSEGGERLLYSALSNAMVGIGFAALLLALMSQLQIAGLTRLTTKKGALWGCAGFITLFAAPSLGLVPEIPGIEAAVLEYRQLWWLFTVICTACALGLLAFIASPYRYLAVLLLFVPHFIGAPLISGPHFLHAAPEDVLALTALHHDFILATGVTNFIFWVVLGLISAWSVNRWVLVNVESH